MVHPMWPWPVLRNRFGSGLAPRIGVPLGVIGTQAGPLLCVGVVGAVRKQRLDRREHVRKVLCRMRAIIAREVGLRRHAQAVAEPGPRDQILLIDPAYRWRRVALADGDRQGIALDRVDRQPQAKIARQERRVAAERNDVGVGLEGTLARLDLRDPAAIAHDALDRRVPVERRAAIADQSIGERIGELVAVAQLVRRAVDRAGEVILSPPTRPARFRRSGPGRWARVARRHR